MTQILSAVLITFLLVVPFVASPAPRVEPKDPPAEGKYIPRAQGFNQKRRR